MMAAATALNVSHPSVWKQVHALERMFGVRLVEPHGRGCFLTPAGQMLVEMAGPNVESLGMLQDRFAAALQEAKVHLAIAVTPRSLVEDLVPCVVKFHSQFARVSFSFLQSPENEIADVVEARRAVFGFTSSPLSEEQKRLLVAEPSYILDVNLVTKKDHPLARRRNVHPRDLRPYPFVNSPEHLPGGAHTQGVLDEHHAYTGKDHLLQTGYAVPIRRFVELGFGIGLVHASRLSPHYPSLHERPMSRYFGKILINVIRRRGGFIPALGEEFIRLVRDDLGSDSSGSRR
jgi:DNA-binding transcriptional LysR family regulator